MTRIAVTLKCEVLPTPLTYYLECDAHNNDSPCTIRLLLAMLRAVEARTHMSDEEFDAEARETAYKILTEGGKTDGK